MAASGTTAALAASTLVARLAQKPLRKANGTFLIAVALFIQWREWYARAPVPEEDEGEQVIFPAAPVEQPQLALGKTMHGAPANSAFELARHLVFGAASGAVLGFFGIGPAWMLAPLLLHTAPDGLGAMGSGDALATVREEK